MRLYLRSASLGERGVVRAWGAFVTRGADTRVPDLAVALSFWGVIGMLLLDLPRRAFSAVRARFWNQRAMVNTVEVVVGCWVCCLKERLGY